MVVEGGDESKGRRKKEGEQAQLEFGKGTGKKTYIQVVKTKSSALWREIK